ncbi:hypothetical protein AAUPMB_09198, partial [Pasteurella multocida subsp. multocida str. Anand1_buffalo]
FPIIIDNRPCFNLIKKANITFAFPQIGMMMKSNSILIF